MRACGRIRASAQADFAKANAELERLKVSHWSELMARQVRCLSGRLRCLLYGRQAELAKSKAEADGLRVRSM